MTFCKKVILLISLVVFVPLNLYAETPQEKCNSISPYYGYHFNQMEIDALLAQWTPLHKDWILERKLFKRTREQLDTMLHFDFAKDVRRINLCGADLRGLDLSKRDLSIANLAYANLAGANLDYTNLIKTSLYHADLSNTQLSVSNLSDANLIEANLTGARIYKTLLSNADLYNANLSESKFYPSPSSIPDPLGLVPTLMKREILFKNVDYYDAALDTFSPILPLLRNEYKKRGMREAERIITYLIQIRVEQTHWQKGGLKQISSGLNWLFFNVPTQYGLHPQRALTFLLNSVLFFTLIYWFALRVDSKHNQFRIVWASKIQTSNSRRGISKGSKPSVMDIQQPLRFRRAETGLLHNIVIELKILRVAFYFSVITAFQMGWRQYNIGEWIGKLQTRAFTLQISRGWIRSVSGFQSLMNLYLLAIWMVTQFGRPFD